MRSSIGYGRFMSFEASPLKHSYITTRIFPICPMFLIGNKAVL